ncbi:MAG: hypothetical protein ACTHKJ_01150, partial [Candidatus Nitrosocosmicus sp.]
LLYFFTVPFLIVTFFTMNKNFFMFCVVHATTTTTTTDYVYFDQFLTLLSFAVIIDVIYYKSNPCYFTH